MKRTTFICHLLAVLAVLVQPAKADAASPWFPFPQDCESVRKRNIDKCLSDCLTAKHEAEVQCNRKKGFLTLYEPSSGCRTNDAGTGCKPPKEVVTDPNRCARAREMRDQCSSKTWCRRATKADFDRCKAR